MSVSTYFYVREPLNVFLFHAGHGDCAWLIDGKEFGRHSKDDSDRYLTIFEPLEVGFHRLECHVFSFTDPLPPLSVSVSRGGTRHLSLLRGPFYPSLPWLHMDLFSWFDPVGFWLFLLGLLGLVPLLNCGCDWFAGVFRRYERAWVWGLCFLGILCAVGFHWAFYEVGLHQYEADEAAFGLMSELLLMGQSPPFFHYGQAYQGTGEVFPLALIHRFMEPSGAALHVLPTLYYALFLLSVVFVFWRYGHARLAVFSLFCLGLGGLHFHWLWSKAWFGYGFSLAAGVLLFWLGLAVSRRGYLSPGPAIAWGLLAGLAFYALPLSLPF
ncbi:hypothetical protein GF373_13035, partial [bacterium]|nr:hypothetical protein [bacterium]